MSKYIIIFFLLTVNAEMAYSQNTIKSQKLLYYVDSKDDSQYLVPFIETTLKELKYGSNRNISLYNPVNSLNIMDQNFELENTISNLYTFINPDVKPKDSQERKGRDTVVSNALNLSDKFLKISIKRFDELLEYEFILFDVAPHEGDFPILTNPISSSVFINPRSSTYKSDILFAIKQVCTESNQPPFVSIKINSVAVNDKYYFASGDTVSLSSIVNDIDSPTERLSYYWQQEGDSGNNPNNILDIDQFSQNQKLVISDTGEYHVSIRVKDGISFSNKSLITFHVIDRPLITGISASYIYYGSRTQIYYQSYALSHKVYFYPVRSLNVYTLFTPSNETELRFEALSQDGETKPLIISRKYTVNASDASTQYGDANICFTYEQFNLKYLDQNHSSFEVGIDPIKKGKGKYSVYVSAVENGIVSKKRKFEIEYKNLSPLSLGYGMNYSRFGVGQKPNITHKELLYQTFYLSILLLPRLEIAYNCDIPYLDKKDSLLKSTNNLQNINHTFHIGYPLLLPSFFKIKIGVDISNFCYPYSEGKNKDWGYGPSLYLSISKQQQFGTFIQASFIRSMPEQPMMPNNMFCFSGGIIFH